MDIDNRIRSALPPGVGDKVINYARSDKGLDRFEALNDHGKPPVADVGLFLYRLDKTLVLDDNLKRLLGKLTFYSLQMRDPTLVPINGVRITPAPYNQFRTGSLFRSAKAAEAPLAA